MGKAGGFGAGIGPWLVAAGLVAAGLAGATPAGAAEPFSVVEADIPALQAAMAEGRVTSREIVTQYLTRLGLYEDRLHAAVSVNARALEIAAERDRERAAGAVRGPLHGIPIAVKDNIHTTDMPTTGGALAFDGYVPPHEATVVTKLRAAGAVIIAKTTLTELANSVSGGTTLMPGNYNAVAGYGFNPYDPRPDPRTTTTDRQPVLTPGGSSSGIGTAANLWTASVGTETSASILVPASVSMLVGVKPTVGRVSRYGIIPVTLDQDTPGPMARTVTDAAILLAVLEGADAHDAATTACKAEKDYRPYLKRDGLKGARIGVPRAGFVDPLTMAGQAVPRTGLPPDQKALLEEAVAVLRAQGAEVVDTDIPSALAQNPQENVLTLNPCSGPGAGKGGDGACSYVFKYGMKRDFNAWLDSLGASAPVTSLTRLRDWNTAHKSRGALRFGQAQLDNADEMDLAADRARYAADRARDLRLSREEGIDAALKAERLDALVFAGWSGAGIGAKAGYPSVIVPFGTVRNFMAAGLPEGFTPAPMPMGITFTASACSEPKLLRLAYAFEQATRRRVPPPAFP